jgi:ribosomal protein S18 acetylase RimI-like enzyme
MKIRRATENDLDVMVEVDKKAYGKYGSDKEYFSKKLKSFPEGILVVEGKGKITGFVVLEILNKDDVQEDFCDMKLEEPIKGKWMHLVAFTTKANYKDKESDTKLLLAAEKIAKTKGCIESCVPLSKYHPFKNNGVFEFWKMNGYKNIGEIKWMFSPNEFVECYFFKKNLIIT